MFGQMIEDFGKYYEAVEPGMRERAYAWATLRQSACRTLTASSRQSICLPRRSGTSHPFSEW